MTKALKRYETISRDQLVEARDVFEHLLKRKTREADWQQFFASYPYVLSSTLPLALRPEHVIPLATPGKAEPDFILYPQDTPTIPFYGVVELKRPDSQIITVTRSNVALLTRDAETAVAQGKVYVEEFGRRLRHANREMLCLGNRAYIFVIMGLEREIAEKLGLKLYREQIEDKLPRNLQLLPYDTVFKTFDAGIPGRVLLLVPAMPLPRENYDAILAELDEEEGHYWEQNNCG
jgi:hypothetical protein